MITLSLVIDVAVLCGLGATIFFAIRLSNALSAFRQHRQDFDRLMTELSQSIKGAYTAIDALKESGDKTGDALQKRVSEAQYLLDELQLMNETGDNLAARLEGLAGQAARKYGVSGAAPEGKKRQEPVDVPAAAGGQSSPLDQKMQNWQDTLKKETGSKSAASAREFVIQDRDFDMGEKPVSNDPNAAPQSFKSQAERELYEALKSKTKG